MPAAALMKKAWLFKPNEYTTSFTLTATFADGQAVFEYAKTEGSWVPKGTHSPRLVISPASESNDWCFVVRVFENDIFDAIRATYANARTSTDGVRVGMKRLVFDKDFYSTHLFEPNCDYDNPYDLFNNSDLGDICFTNLTKNITLPNKKENYGHWYGWGAYNQTKPYSKLNKINDYDNLYRMPLSWIYSTQLEGFPTIDINDSTSEHPNISKLCEAPMVDDVIYMVPLYHNETPYYDIDTEDYGEPVYPIEPEPPMPDVDPNQKVFINAVPDYDGNWYDAVIIGDQVWMAENLKTTHFTNGDSIPLFTQELHQQNNFGTLGAYFYPDNDADNKEKYGLLYAPYLTVGKLNDNDEDDSRKLAPTGWHIPTKNEWDSLQSYVGTEYNDDMHPAYYLYSNNSSDWNNGEFSSLWNNQTGFTALPAGYGVAGYNGPSLTGGIEFSRIVFFMQQGENDTMSSTCCIGGVNYPMFLNTDLAVAGRYASIRCVCDLSTQEFTTWYYNEYGSYSHELDA